MPSEQPGLSFRTKRWNCANFGLTHRRPEKSSLTWHGHTSMAIIGCLDMMKKLQKDWFKHSKPIPIM